MSAIATASMPAAALASAAPRVRAPHRVDFSYLDRIGGGDAAYVVLMARLFCAHFPEQMFLAEVAATRADAPALRHELMRLATTCQLLGLPRLVALAQQLSERLLPASGWPAHTAATLRHLRRGGTAAMRSLAEQLHERYPQALGTLLHPLEEA